MASMLERRREKKAAIKSEQALARWQTERDAQAELIRLAESFAGEPTSEVMLKKGEALFLDVSGASLVELRRGAGTWEGRSQGVSIPIGSLGGRSIRYRVGASKGHYIQGTPHPTAIDTGSMLVTNQRVVFKGATQTRECLYSKLIGYEHSADGSTTFSVSNRQKPTTIHYGPQIGEVVHFRLELAIAHFRDDVASFVDGLRQGLAAIDAEKPAVPIES